MFVNLIEVSTRRLILKRVFLLTEELNL